MKTDKRNISKAKIVSLALIALGAILLIFHTLAFTGPSSGSGIGSGALGTDAAGNVSIGTSTTQANTKLLILGSTTDSSAYGLQVLNSNKTAVFTVRNDGTVSIPSTLSAGTFTGTSAANNISSGQFGANTGNGNYSFPASVGIGTAVPSSTLSVGGPGISGAAIYGNGSTFGVYGNGPYGVIGYGTGLSGYGVYGVNTSTNATGVYGLGGSGGNGVFGNVTVGTGVFGNGTVGVQGTGVTDGVVGNGTGSTGIGGYFTNSGGGPSLVTGNGNVGIGTTTPAYPLSVNGQVNATGYCISAANCISSWPSGGTSQWNNNANGIAYGGDIFIGSATSSLSGLLNVGQNGGAPAGTAIFGYDNAYGVYGDAPSGVGVYGIGSTDGVEGQGASFSGAGGYFFNNSGPALVTGNGNVGIGTWTPNAALDVNGVINGKNYSIPLTNATAQWVKVGTFTAGQTGEAIRITANIHQGYNAANSQDSIYYIAFKTSNGGSVDGSGFAGNGSWYAIGSNNSIPSGDIVWVANAAGVSATSFSLYMNLPAFVNGSYYEVALDQAASWTNVGTTGQTNPGSASSLVMIPPEQFNIPYGNVGIGTAGPVSTLSVGGAGMSGTGIYGTGNFNGIWGDSPNGIGVDGYNDNNNGWGVYGQGGDGVVGLGIGANSDGVEGQSGGATGYGVYGAGHYAIYGSGAYGVYGVGSTADFWGGNGEHTSGATWVNGSSRTLKENFTTLDDQAILGKIMELPVTQWDYKSDKTANHIGPMAEDFYAIFGLGDDNKSISTIDPAGIALVGIKALKENNDAQQKEIDAQQQEINTLQTEIKLLTH